MAAVRGESRSDEGVVIRMLNERTLWRAAVTVAIALLLLMIFQPPQRRERAAPGFDEPGPRPAIWRTVRVAHR